MTENQSEQSLEMSCEIPENLADVAVAICQAVEKYDRKEVQTLLLGNEIVCKLIFECVSRMKRCQCCISNTSTSGIELDRVLEVLSNRNDISIEYLIRALFMLPISHEYTWMMIERCIFSPYSRNLSIAQDEYWVNEAKILLRSIALSANSPRSRIVLSERLNALLYNIAKLCGIDESPLMDHFKSKSCLDESRASDNSCNHCVSDVNFNETIIRALGFLPDITHTFSFLSSVCYEKCTDFVIDILMRQKSPSYRTVGLSRILSLIYDMKDVLRENQLYKIRNNIFLLLHPTDEYECAAINSADIPEICRYCIEFLNVYTNEISSEAEKKQVGQDASWEEILYRLYTFSAHCNDASIVRSTDNIFFISLSQCSFIVSERLVKYLETFTNMSERLQWVGAKLWLLLLCAHDTNIRSTKLTSILLPLDHTATSMTKKRLLNGLFYPIIKSLQKNESKGCLNLRQFSYLDQGRFLIDGKRHNICNAASIVYESVVHKTKTENVNTQVSCRWLDACFSFLETSRDDPMALTCVVKSLVTLFFEDVNCRSNILSRLVRIERSDDRNDVLDLFLSTIDNSVFEASNLNDDQNKTFIWEDGLEQLFMIFDGRNDHLSISTLPLTSLISVINVILHFPKGKLVMLNFVKTYLDVTFIPTYCDVVVVQPLVIHSLYSFISKKYYLESNSACIEALQFLCTLISLNRPSLSFSWRNMLYSRAGSSLRSNLLSFTVAKSIISSLIHRVFNYFDLECDLLETDVMSLNFIPTLCFSKWQKVFEDTIEHDIRDDFVGLFQALGRAILFCNAYKKGCISIHDITSFSRFEPKHLIFDSDIRLESLLILCHQSFYAFITSDTRRPLISGYKGSRELYNHIESINRIYTGSPQSKQEIGDSNSTLIKQQSTSIQKPCILDENLSSRIRALLCLEFVKLLMHMDEMPSSNSIESNRFTSLLTSRLFALMMDNYQHDASMKGPLHHYEFSFRSEATDYNDWLQLASDFLHITCKARQDKVLSRLDKFDERSSTLFRAIGFNADRIIEILSKSSLDKSSRTSSTIRVIFERSCYLYAQIGTEEMSKCWIRLIESNFEIESIKSYQALPEQADDIVRLLRNRLLLVITKSITHIRTHSSNLIDLGLKLEPHIRDAMHSLSVSLLQQSIDPTLNSTDEPSCSLCYLLERIVNDLSNGFHGLSGLLTSTTYKIMIQCIGECCSLLFSYSDKAILNGNINSMYRLIDASVSKIWNILCCHGLRHSSLLRYTLRLILQDLPRMLHRLSFLGSTFVSEADDIPFIALKQCINILTTWYEKQSSAKTPCWIYPDSDSEDDQRDAPTQTIIRLRSPEMWSVTTCSIISSLESIWSTSIAIMKGKALNTKSSMRYLTHRRMIMCESICSLYLLTRPTKLSNKSRMECPRVLYLFSSTAKAKVLSCINKILDCLRLSIQTIESSLRQKHDDFSDMLNEGIMCLVAIIISKKKIIPLFKFPRAWFSMEQHESTVSAQMNKHFDDESILSKIHGMIIKIEMIESKLQQFAITLKKTTDSIDKTLFKIMEGSPPDKSLYGIVSNFIRELTSQRNNAGEDCSLDLDNDYADFQVAKMKKNLKRRNELKKKRKFSDVPRSRNQGLDGLLALDAVDGYEQDNDTFADLEDFLE